jgi:dipeptidyl aminopeptidase/acylaminoacyl peptidase
MLLKRTLPLLVSVAALLPISVFAQTKRHFSLDDLGKFVDVRDAQCSPDGKTVAYVQSQTDVKADRGGNSHIWTISWDGKVEQQITSSESSESSPRWSPDSKYLAFTSSRPGKVAGNQVWLLPRAGGEALQLTGLDAKKGRIQSFEWSPDSTKMALIIGDPDPDAPDPDAAATPAAAPAAGGGRGGRGAGGAAPKPIVIDRYHYKQDGQGYLLSGRHSYIYIFDIETKKLDRLTTQKQWDESAAQWSPDSKRIAFTSNHVADPDREPGGQIYVADAKPGSTEKSLTPSSERGGGGRGGRPEWSHNGKWIAFLQGEDKKWGAYSQEKLAIVATDGSSAPQLVKSAAAIDRGVSNPRWTEDDTFISATVTDDMSVTGAAFPIGNGDARFLFKKPIMVGQRHSAGDCAVSISGSDTAHNEIYAMRVLGKFEQLTHKNDALMNEIEWGKTEEISAKSKDGTEVHGLLTYPVGYVAGTKVPMLLRIHGGPKGQDAHSLSMESQFFAANGYAVLRVNYRGSDGRGSAYQKAIAADWGHFEVEDLKAGVDKVIAMGVADPDKLGVGGWSYGGILTDYMIASDTRFKAATSGAGTAFTVAFYGTDQYIIQYDFEIGPPWNPKAWETYQKISYPFLHADRIKTPTMFLGGERDFNVPVQGGQQMYQALRSLGIETQLIIYPNENHGISRPSYVRDRYERYLAWYDKYILHKVAPVKEPATTTGGGNNN